MSFLEIYRTRLIMGALIVFLLSGIASCQELKYLTSGKHAVASITRTYEQVDRRHNTTEYIAMYRFTDDAGEDRNAGLNMASLDDLHPGEKLDIIYTKFASRPAGQPTPPLVYVFLLFLAIVLGFLGYFAIQAYRETRKPSPTYRRR